MHKALKQAIVDFKGALRSGERGQPREDEEGTPSEQSSTVEDQSRSAVAPGPPPRIAEPVLDDKELAESAASEREDEETSRRASKGFGVRQGLTLVATLAAAWLIWQNIGSWLWPEPADKGVVAAYTEGTVTKEELIATLDSHPEPERAALATTDGLRLLIEDVVVHRVVERWANERQLDEKNSVQHAMKHAAEEINLHDVGTQIHQSQIRVEEADIQKYYEENRERMGDRPLAEVRDSIRETLHASKEKEYIQGYLRDLRARASVTVDYQLLAVPEPTDEELSSYYLSHRADFSDPERVRVQEMRFVVTSKEQEAVQQAEKALARVQAGEDFSLVAQELAARKADSQGTGSDEITRGTRGSEFDEKVFSLREGEVTPVFKEEDAYLVVKSLERRRERTKAFDEVRDEIRRKLEGETATAVYAGNKEKTLFTIRGRRFTVGEFLDEYQNFPLDVQARYRDFEAKNELVDRLIDRLLVLDSASSEMLDVKNQKEIEEARRHVLAEILHQEEMQDKLQASDEEVKEFYDRHRTHYTEPPRVKISYIRVGMGGSEEGRKEARRRIDEAAKKLQAAKAQTETFAEVAKEFSEDPDAAAEGGDLDRWLTRQDDYLSHALAHDFTEAVFRLRVGQISPVIAMGDSYYIVRVREKQEEELLAFEQAKALAREDPLAEKHSRALAEMQAELTRRMRLVVYDNRIRELVKEISGTSSSQPAAINSQSEPSTGR